MTVQPHPDHADALTCLVDEGWVSEILYEVRSGKEATVFCCRGGPRSPRQLVAAKVYRPIERRRFRNDAPYVDGRLHMVRNGRARRAVQSGSAFGRRVQQGTWLWQEWQVLQTLHEAGAAVPCPLACGERVILLPFLGDERQAAPMLHEAVLTTPEVTRVLDDLLDNVELMLDCHCVHGDLSAFNVMLHRGEPVIIDFPQAIDPRLNRSGFPLLLRDVENVCRWAARLGVHRPAAAIASGLWERFVTGEIG